MLVYARNFPGHEIPTKISTALLKFLGKQVATKMARTEVTREINTYICAHNLQDPNNEDIIFCDRKLRKLFEVSPETRSSMKKWHFQNYLSPHFAPLP